MSKDHGSSLIVKLYEWAHRKFPKYADCRPIYVEQSIRDAGFNVKYREKVKLFGLPGKIVVGRSSL